ncbi:MAG: hypothetical protein ACKJSK_11075 [Roseibacillus sp.]
MTAYRQGTRLPSPSSVREEPPSYATSPSSERDPDEDRLEEFLHYLRTIESEPKSTLARQLISDGIELPPPETFSGDPVRDKLWEVIYGLARRRHYLSSTDHLSDFELYRHLWEITLNEANHELTLGLGDCACHIDLVGDGSAESIWLWLRYYADEESRRDWAGDFPGDHIPERLPLPYDRDHYLPTREFLSRGGS